MSQQQFLKHKGQREFDFLFEMFELSFWETGREVFFVALEPKGIIFYAL